MSHLPGFHLTTQVFQKAPDQILQILADRSGNGTLGKSAVALHPMRKEKLLFFSQLLFFKEEIEKILHGNGLRGFIFIMQADNIDKNDKKKEAKAGGQKRKQHFCLRE